MNSKPLVLNNGVYLQSTEWSSASHLDKSHVQYLNKDSGPSTDLGIVTPFVTAGYKLKPYLYDFSGRGARRIFLDGHTYTWKTPLNAEPCYILKDMSGTDKPGMAGEKFKVKLSNNHYGNGYILAIDQHDPHHMMVTEDEIIQDGDGYIHTMKLVSVDQANRWFPKEYLRPNTKLFPITTVTSEYAQEYANIPTMSGGMREYYNTVGESSAALYYSVSRDAAYSKIKDTITSSIRDYRKVIEMYVFRPGSLAYDLSLKGQQSKGAGLMNEYQKAYGMGSASGRLNSDIVLRSWVPEIELTGIAWLEAMVEQAAMWGSGGKVNVDGRRSVKLPLGLFHQLNMGNTHSYNLFNMTLEKFEFMISSRLVGKEDFDPGSEFVIKTGRGGLAMVRNWLRYIPGNNGMITDSKDYTRNHGSQHNKNLIFDAPEYTGWSMRNGMGTIKFELAPGLDPTDANMQVNPVIPASKGIGGHRLSSYMFIIDDITNSMDGNIYELLYGPDWDISKRHISGKLNYMGTDNFASAGHHPGFEVFLEKRHKAYWVKDITKSLLIKPINPFTGREIYSSYHR